MVEDKEKTIIEINGIKMEIDTRHATRVENFRVGSKVKVLIKDYSTYKSYHGVVVGFDGFKKLPTMIVAYLDVDYSKSNLKFAYINTESENVELVLSIDDELPMNKADLLVSFNNERNKLKAELEELERKEAYFLRHFNSYFNDAELVGELK
ncbi:hypothetical protein KAR91_47980 [Candidatus Pacearchaeota archaeon]|nr:hypothetical protein [Candidatus Pacearchaeota archaeon]